MTVLQGQGAIHLDTGEQGPVSYIVEEWSRPQARGGDGRIHGDLALLLAAVRYDGEITLEIDDGRRAPIAVIDWDPIAGSLFTLHGPFD